MASIPFFGATANSCKTKPGNICWWALACFCFGIIAYMISTSVIDLRRGFKHRITGKITDKKLDVRTSTTHSSNGKTGSSSSHSSTSRHYYVCIDDVQYSIEQQYYGKVKVGNDVILEKAPKSNITLLLEVTKTERIK